MKLFKISAKGLALGQVQQVGSIFFNQTTNIFISFIAAKAVVEGQMTLGMMMSLTYIISQMNGPVSSSISFSQQLQDAKISLERLNEIHGREDEEQKIDSKLQKLKEWRASGSLTEQTDMLLFHRIPELGFVQTAYSSCLLAWNNYLQHMQENRIYETEVINAVATLQVALTEWETNYLLKSPVNGTIAFMQLWKPNQNVEAGVTKEKSLLERLVNLKFW